ncbi:MAG: DUF512 domain-containing protein [Eubacteriales bacterium]|nr:DUF512 domain-containing protein [Eubacteriales bacterium]
MKKHVHEIAEVFPGSIADQCGLVPGDKILSINGNDIQDIFDYQFYIEDEYLEILIREKNGEEYILEIEKDEEEDLGVAFEESLMDQYHSCTNKCVFCFIDQMPPGMRDTLYFKDDDSRLSFLQGNYITLTNMKMEDIDRIIRYHLAPINISVHATNPELRCKLLNNRFAGDLLEKIKRFADANIEMNSQIVLCKNLNDKEELDRTIEDLSKFYPAMGSVSVVPVGVTKFREGLAAVETFDKESAKEVLSQIKGWQERLKESLGNTFVHASDEWFIMAEEEIPEADYYEGFGQLENGVGMMRLLIDEVEEALEACEGDDRAYEFSVATAKLAYPTIVDLASKIEEKYPNIKIHVYCIRNDYFGESITVSGLLTGIDIINQLKGKPLGECLFLPVNVLKADEDIFLDDITLDEMCETLQTPVNIIESDGEDFVRKLTRQ